MAKEIKTKENEELSAALVERLFNGAHHGAEALVEIQFFDFFILFFVFFSNFVSLKLEVHQVSAQLDGRCGLEKFAKIQHEY
jgi:hypothetical protein